MLQSTLASYLTYSEAPRWQGTNVFPAGGIVLNLKCKYCKVIKNKSLCLYGMQIPGCLSQLTVQFCCSVESISAWPYELQHPRPPCPSLTPGACSNSCPSSWWCHQTSSFSVTLFSSCLQTFPASGSFPMSQFFASGGQSIGVSNSTSVLPWIFRTVPKENGHYISRIGVYSSIHILESFILN